MAAKAERALPNWREEKQAAFLYAVMARVEADPQKRELFGALEEATQAQADAWAAEIAADGGRVPEDYRPPMRAKLAAWLLKRLGVRPLRPVLRALKVRGLSAYLGTLAGHPMPAVAPTESNRHRGVKTGGTLRAAVFGVNDGLVSNTSLILGMAGAAQSSKVVLLAGIAGLLAGAFSMAAGEFVSVNSQRELFEFQIGLERDELALYPKQEAEELALIYNARGVPLNEARSLATRLLETPSQALDTLAREELGLNPEELGSPWGAALYSFLAFSTGSLIPLLPFLFAPNRHPVALAAGLGVAGLFGVGAALSLFTGRSALLSGLRMALIGGLAALATYLIGRWLGVSLS